jgi:hypothetical protein
MAIQQTTLTTSPQAIFTASADTAVTVLNFCNTANSIDTAFDLYIVPSGGSADASTQTHNQVEITQTNTYVIDAERYILNTGDAIFAAANDAGIITATVSTLGV